MSVCNYNGKTDITKQVIALSREMCFLSSRIATTIPSVDIGAVADITALQAINDDETFIHVKDADRGGTFIYSTTANTADGGIVFAATGKGGGYWIRQYEASLPINVKWFGAKGDGTTDDYAILQAVLDYGVAHQTTTNKIYFPAGNYSISAPLIIYKWTGTAYSQTSIAITGESNYAASPVTQITPTYKNTFAIGIQQGKGVTIQGISIVGKFTVPTLSTYQFYTTDFASYVDATCRDSAYSPYSGIVIDPFSNSTSSVPSDGGYPGLTSYYRGTGGQSGSTGTLIINVSISNFVVGIMSSPNGFTRNAELSLFERITIANCKLGFAASQDQEKTCVIRTVKSWGTTHTLFATSYYGVGTPGNWIIEGAQIAGNVNTFLYSNGGSYYPTFIKNCFAEGLGTIGYISSSLSSSVEDCVFNLAIPSSTYGNTIMGYKLTGSRAVFRNCTFRFYGYSVSMPFQCNHTFEACSFDKIPYNLNIDGVGKSADFINCRLTSDGILGATGLVPNITAYNSNNSVYGNYEIKDRQDARYGVYATTHVSSDVLGIKVVTGDAAITIDANRSFTIQSTSTYIDDFTVGDLILFSSDAGVNYLPAGYVSAIDTGTYIVTVVYASPLMSSTTYKFALYHPYQYGVEFLGDVTSGSNVITNVILRNGFGAFSNMVGKFIKHPYARRNGDNYSPYIKVVSYDGGTNTLTLSRNHIMTTTETGVFFSNHGTLSYEVYNSGALGVNDMLQKDSFYAVNNVKYIVEKSGFLVGADPRQAIIRQVSGRTLYGTGVLDFGSISAAASADLTISVTGAAVNDSVSLGLPASPTAGIVFSAFVSSTDTITVRATNITASPVDPSSATYKVKVIKY